MKLLLAVERCLLSVFFHVDVNGVSCPGTIDSILYVPVGYPVNLPTLPRLERAQAEKILKSEKIPENCCGQLSSIPALRLKTLVSVEQAT